MIKILYFLQFLSLNHLFEWKNRKTFFTKKYIFFQSSIVTETYSGGQFADGGNVKPTVLVPGENQVKYLSLGPNIYGKIKTLFATYTYFTTDVLGSVAKSMEVITQVYIIFTYYEESLVLSNLNSKLFGFIVSILIDTPMINCDFCFSRFLHHSLVHQSYLKQLILKQQPKVFN